MRFPSTFDTSTSTHNGNEEKLRAEKELRLFGANNVIRAINSLQRGVINKHKGVEIIAARYTPQLRVFSEKYTRARKTERERGKKKLIIAVITVVHVTFVYSNGVYRCLESLMCQIKSIFRLYTYNFFFLFAFVN